MQLKYGMNPHQKGAEIDLKGHLQILSGNPSYINFMDALNSWQLVREMQAATGKASAASFKHVSPSGASTASDFLPGELDSYNCKSRPKDDQTKAYLKARGSDRLASFGDFIAISDSVEVELARLIRSEVSDGIIAPAYSEEALEILKTKKRGGYCIIQIDPDYMPPASESREIFGFRLTQNRNSLTIGKEQLDSIKTSSRTLPTEVEESLLAGLIALKYTQSNSISVAYKGHVIGIGAGQQSRILCSELALIKANKWYQKTRLNYPGIDYSVLAKETKTNKDLLHDTLRESEFKGAPLMRELDGLCLCSDAFFPQTDNIELARQYGVKYIAAPMGSIRDQDIISKCNDYGITFIELGFRLFHH